MTISRTKLFLVFVLLLAVPLVMNKILWLSRSKETTGIFYYKTRGNALDQFRKSYSICYFLHKGNDTIWFNGPGSLQIKEGATIKVRYQSRSPSDARVMSFRGFWGGTIIYGGLVFIVILVAFLNKGVFPRESKFGFTNKRALIHIT